MVEILWRLRGVNVAEGHKADGLAVPSFAMYLVESPRVSTLNARFSRRDMWITLGFFWMVSIQENTRHLCVGMCGCRGASGAATRPSRLIWPITHGHVPSHESVRAHANRPGERTLRDDPIRVTQASGEASCLHNSIQAGSPRPVATSHIPAHIRARLVLHGEGASWVRSPLPWGHPTRETRMTLTLFWF